jgi:hypothetical protein
MMIDVNLKDVIPRPKKWVTKIWGKKKTNQWGKRAWSEDFYFGQSPPVQDNQKTIRDANVPKGI